MNRLAQWWRRMFRPFRMDRMDEHDWTESFTIGGGPAYQSGGWHIQPMARTLQLCKRCGATSAMGRSGYGCKGNRWPHGPDGAPD